MFSWYLQTSLNWWLKKHFFLPFAQQGTDLTWEYQFWWQEGSLATPAFKLWNLEVKGWAFVDSVRTRRQIAMAAKTVLVAAISLRLLEDIAVKELKILLSRHDLHDYSTLWSAVGRKPKGPADAAMHWAQLQGSGRTCGSVVSAVGCVGRALTRPQTQELLTI